MTDLPGILLLSLRFLLALTLYLFLAWAVRIIWQDLRQIKTVSQQQAINPLLLTIDAGPNDLTTHFLINPENILGRGPNCDINLQDETVSGQHARFYFEHKHWWLQDLGSSNGTYLNDLPLDQAAVLTDKDHLRFGGITAEVQLQEELLDTSHDLSEGIDT